jgi:predicted ATPase
VIKRLYIHNYRCFENFDLKIDEQHSVLVLGRNGAGKSSLSSALRMLQNIARGDNRTRQFLKRADFAFDQTDKPVRIELTAQLNGREFHYAIAFEFPTNFKEPKIVHERLAVDGTSVFDRTEAEVSLQDGAIKFLVDWHVAALPVVQVRGQKNALEEFKDWLAKTVLIAPMPSGIGEESEVDSMEPTKHVDNFADWFSGVLSEFPASYSTIEKFLKQLMPDFLDFQNKTAGETTRRIVVRFAQGERIYSTGLSRLSDGEKIIFVTAVLLAANTHLGPLFCFWDEPDNFVSLSEVGHMIAELRKSFKHSGSGQIILTSHNPESIRKFSDESTLFLTRASHLEPARGRWLSDLEYDGDLINALIRGDVADASGQ